MNRLIRLALLAAWLPLLAAAQAPRPVALAPLLPHPPDLSTADIRTATVGMAQVSGFLQRSPSDGAPASAPTIVYLGRDAARLYLVWVCTANAHSLRAHLGPRDHILPDEIYNDDFVEVTLDPGGDGRHGFAFAANPLGIQTDALWTESTSVRDPSWDARWSARGRITPFGYVVEMEIPFASMGARAGLTSPWGITLERYFARHDEQSFWPRVTSSVAGLLIQEAKLASGESSVPTAAIPARRSRLGGLEITPYLYGRNYHLADPSSLPGAPTFRDARASTRAGADVRWALPGGFLLDVTANPDFSQLASDQPQFTVNQPFQIAYPEKRPFFLENANLFDSPGSGLNLTQLVFTRNIADPDFGLKFSGKRGPWELAALAADDRSPGESVGPADPEFHRHAQFTLLRAVRDWGQESSIGAQYTGRELHGSYNRVAALDARLRLNPNWSTFARAAVSDTACDNGSALCLGGTSEFSAPTAFGRHRGGLGEATVNGHGRRFRLDAQYQDISPSFHTDTGFLPRTDIRNLYGYYHYYFRPEGRHLVNWGLESNLQRIWDHSGRGLSYLMYVSPYFGFGGNTRLYFPEFSTTSDTIRPQDFAGLSRAMKFIHNSVGFDFRTAPVGWGSFNIQLFHQGTINQVVPSGMAPRLGIETTVNATLALKPGRRWQVSTVYLLDRVMDPASGQLVFRNDIVRPQLQLYLSPRFGLRLIPQYNRLLANPAFSSLQPSRNLNFDLLASYIVHPGTEFYLGYNSDLQDPAPGWQGRLPLRLRNDGRQVFVKMSYQFTPGSR